MKKYNSFYVEVSTLADGNAFDVGPVRTDERGTTYRVFTVYDTRHPWQGVVEYGVSDGTPGWHYVGECWPL